jgi:hypothetical protein
LTPTKARISAAPGRGGLESFAPLFLCLYAFVLAALAAYRVRALPILASISPDLASGDGLAAYASAAAWSDALAVALVVSALALLWLLSAAAGGVLGRAPAWR